MCGVGKTENRRVHVNVAIPAAFKVEIQALFLDNPLPLDLRWLGSCRFDLVKLSTGGREFCHHEQSSSPPRLHTVEKNHPTLRRCLCIPPGAPPFMLSRSHR